MANHTGDGADLAEHTGDQRCAFCNKLGARLWFARSRPRPARAGGPVGGPRGRERVARVLPARPAVDYYAHVRCLIATFGRSRGEAALLRLPAKVLGVVDPSELSARTRERLAAKFWGSRGRGGRKRRR